MSRVTQFSFRERTGERPWTRAMLAVAFLTFVASLTAVLDGWAGTGRRAGSRPTRQERPAGTGGDPVAGEPAPCRVVIDVTRLSERARLAQLLLVGVETRAQAAAALAGDTPAAGVFLLSTGATWFADGSLKELAAKTVTPPIIAADEEGGRVTRISAVAGAMPSARSMATSMSPAAVEQVAEKRGRELLAVGVNMDLAPVADLYDGKNAAINDRAFSPDPGTVVTYAGAFAAGLRRAGVSPTLKHFPGHGHSSGDSHVRVVRTPGLRALEGADLKPFAQLAPGFPAVMVGHLEVPELTEPNRPASLSQAAIQSLLRGRLGYTGYVVTDDISMAAITSLSTVPDAAVRAIAAGADGVLLTPDSSAQTGATVDRLQRALHAGEITPGRLAEALNHLTVFKRNMYCPAPAPA